MAWILTSERLPETLAELLVIKEINYHPVPAFRGSCGWYEYMATTESRPIPDPYAWLDISDIPLPDQLDMGSIVTEKPCPPPDLPPHAVGGFGRDADERKNLEDRLFGAEKQESEE